MGTSRVCCVYTNILPLLSCWGWWPQARLHLGLTASCWLSLVLEASLFNILDHLWIVHLVHGQFFWNILSRALAAWWRWSLLQGPTLRLAMIPCVMTTIMMPPEVSSNCSCPAKVFGILWNILQSFPHMRKLELVRKSQPLSAQLHPFWGNFFHCMQISFVSGSLEVVLCKPFQRYKCFWRPSLFAFVHSHIWRGYLGFNFSALQYSKRRFTNINSTSFAKCV